MEAVCQRQCQRQAGGRHTGGSALEGGQGNFGVYGTENARKVLVWNFREPLDLDEVVGIYMNEEYFPVK